MKIFLLSLFVSTSAFADGYTLAPNGDLYIHNEGYTLGPNNDLYIHNEGYTIGPDGGLFIHQ